MRRISHYIGVLLLGATLAAHAEPSAETAGATLPAQQEEVLLYALSLNGTQYKFGGRSEERGFDCSGFVGHVFRQVAGLSLPPTASAISQLGAQIDKTELQPGDLVFFNTLRRAFSHVGIYLGDNRFIHASSSKTGDVMISNMTEHYWSKRFNGARRIARATQ